MLEAAVAIARGVGHLAVGVAELVSRISIPALIAMPVIVIGIAVSALERSSSPEPWQPEVEDAEDHLTRACGCYPPSVEPAIIRDLDPSRISDVEIAAAIDGVLPEITIEREPTMAEVFVTMLVVAMNAEQEPWWRCRRERSCYVCG